MSRNIWFTWSRHVACQRGFWVVKPTHRNFHAYSHTCDILYFGSFVTTKVSWQSLDCYCRVCKAKNVPRIWRNRSGCNFWKQYQHRSSNLKFPSVLAATRYRCALNWKRSQLVTRTRHTAEWTRASPGVILFYVHAVGFMLLLCSLCLHYSSCS